MIEMAKFPYLTDRKGSCNLYYKREVSPQLRAEGRPSQVWRSLRTSDRKKAEAAYGAKHAEVEALFAQWRQDDTRFIHDLVGGRLETILTTRHPRVDIEGVV